MDLPGLVRFDRDEVERIERVKLIRLGLSPSQIDELDTFDKLDVLELVAVERYFEQKQLAQLIAVETAKLYRRRR